MVLVVVKSGGGGVPGGERMVREAVRSGAVEWVELRVATGESGAA